MFSSFKYSLPGTSIKKCIPLSSNSLSHLNFPPSLGFLLLSSLIQFHVFSLTPFIFFAFIFFYFPDWARLIFPPLQKLFLFHGFSPLFSRLPSTQFGHSRRRKRRKRRRGPLKLLAFLRNTDSRHLRARRCSPRARLRRWKSFRRCQSNPYWHTKSTSRPLSLLRVFPGSIAHFRQKVLVLNSNAICSTIFSLSRGMTLRIDRILVCVTVRMAVRRGAVRLGCFLHLYFSRSSLILS